LVVPTDEQLEVGTRNVMYFLNIYYTETL
jgi:hypothetical protein